MGKNELIQVVNLLYCDDRGIIELERLIKEECIREERINPNGSSYLHNLKQTRDKKLKPLIDNRDKIRKRISLFESAKMNFLADLSSLL